jgi:hypothetical protein
MAIAPVDAVLARLNVTEASVPLPIAFAFIPEMTQVYAPEIPEHDRDFPAAVAAVPAAALKEVMLAEGYATVHCTATGWLEAGEEIETLRVTLPPCGAEPEEIVKAG